MDDAADSTSDLAGVVGLPLGGTHAAGPPVPPVPALPLPAPVPLAPPLPAVPPPPPAPALAPAPPPVPPVPVAWHFGSRRTARPGSKELAIGGTAVAAI